MPIDRARALPLLKGFDFRKLFLEELGWDKYAVSLEKTVDGETYSLHAIAEKRNIIFEADGAKSQESSVLEFQALARDPSPDEVAMLAETIEQLLHGLEPHQQKIVRLSLEERATADIAGLVGVSQKSVQRVLKGVRERLEGWIAEEKKPDRPAESK